jgi:hypothetical protein
MFLDEDEKESNQNKWRMPYGLKITLKKRKINALNLGKTNLKPHLNNDNSWFLSILSRLIWLKIIMLHQI